MTITTRTSRTGAGRKTIALTTVPAPFVAVVLLVAFPALVACDRHGEGRPVVSAGDHSLDAGYAVLRRLLGDEQHLDTLRLAKSIVALRESNAATVTLVDDIATTSADSLAGIDRLATLEPEIRFGDREPAQLGREIFEALRVTAVKELVLSSGDDFELNLVLSQTQALRLVSHLARELRKLDPNEERQAWLEVLAARYDELYRRAVARLSLAAG